MSKNNLFHKLFIYKKNNKRSPLENFTTEALRYFLENNEDLRLFVLSKSGLKNFRSNKFIIKSQVDYCDLLIKQEDGPHVIVIEHKIHAPFKKAQLEKYKCAAKKKFQDAKVYGLALLKNQPESTEMSKDPIIYWFELGKEIEKEIKEQGLDGDRELLKQFLFFLKEENMVSDKVNWQLIEGVRARLKLKNMIGAILKKFYDGRKLQKKGSGTTGADFDQWAVVIPNSKKETTIVFSHNKCSLYFLVKGDDVKLADCPDGKWKAWKVLKEFDLNSTHFFPLEADEQEQKIVNFIKSGIDVFEKKTLHKK